MLAACLGFRPLYNTIVGQESVQPDNPTRSSYWIQSVAGVITRTALDLGDHRNDHGGCFSLAFALS